MKGYSGTSLDCRFLCPGVFVIALSSWISTGGETAIVLDDQGTRNASLTTDGVSEGYQLFQLRDETTWSRYIVPKAEHYVLYSNFVVAVAAQSSRLRLTRSIRPDLFQDSLSENTIWIRWDEIFGSEATTKSVDSSVRRLAEIRNVRLSGERIEISVTLADGNAGLMVLNSGLKVVSVKLGSKSLPVFNQPASLSHPEEPSAPISHESIMFDGRQIDVWKRLFEHGEKIICEARIRFDTKEVTWIGPHPARWVLVDEQLIGIAACGDDILIRAAIPSDVVSASGIKRLVDLEQRLFSGDLISVRHAESEKLEGLNIDEVKSHEGLIRVRFSASVPSSPISGEVSYSLSRREASLQISSEARKLSESE